MVPQSKQEIFDFVARNLLKQGKPSHIDGECRYRMDGLKCAAGWLIPDEEYDRHYEGNTISGVPYFTNNHLFSSELLDLIDDLQEAHDLYTIPWPQKDEIFENPESWKMAWISLMYDVARNHNLNTKVFENDQS